MDEAEWEHRVGDAWASIDEYEETEFRALIESLTAELPPGSGTADFERAAAYDSTGHSDLAVPLYRQALDAGLTGERRRRAIIQMASSIRNLGRPEESIALLTAELARTSDHLDDALRAVLALALTDVGREREAVSITITALAAHLPRYQRSMANYARLLLVEPNEDVVRRIMASYMAGDRATAETLIADEFVFTSPQDDHIDRAAYLERCFPTSDRFSRHELTHVVATGDDVFVMYEDELRDTGETFRNAELITVRDGQIVEVQVFFGGRATA